MKKSGKSKVKKSGRRARSKHPYLDPKLNLPSRQADIDYDYIHKLSESEKDWLNKFTAEEIGADFRHAKPLNRTKASRRRCYGKNNSRNRDLYTKWMLENKLTRTTISKADTKQSITTAKFNAITEGNPEDALLMVLDLLAKKTDD